MKNTKMKVIASAILLSQLLLSLPSNVLASEQPLYSTNQSGLIEDQQQINTNNTEDQTDSEQMPELEEEKTETSDTDQIEEQEPQDQHVSEEIPEKFPEEQHSITETTDSSESKDQHFNSTVTKPSKNTEHSSVNKQSTEINSVPTTMSQEISFQTGGHAYERTETQHPSVTSEPVNENIYFEKNESVESFIRKIGEAARKIGQENDLYASVMIAQAILESASGQSELAQAPNYNLFGIKGTHNGKGISFTTQEALDDGTLYNTQATFRKYENYEDSLKDYAQLLKGGLPGNSQYYNGVWKTNAKTYQEATKFLTGRYATDTKYDQKLNVLIETYHLADYDKEVAGPQINKKGYIVPVKNYTISSSFGNREGEFHRGLDFAAAQGEPIYASKAGTVIKAEFHPSWGNYVVIKHEDGTTALYAHQQEYQVNVGDKVKQGQIIGYVGSTGNSTGSHLHFELCLDNSLNQSQLIDPKTILF